MGDVRLKKIIFCLLLFSICLLQVNASPETLGDLRTTYNELVEEQEKNNRKTEEAKAEIKQKEQAIKDAQEAISLSEEAIEKANQEIEESNVKINTMTDNVNKVLVTLQQLRSQNAYLEYASGASTVTDFVTRIAALEQMSSYMQDVMKKLEQEIADNEALKKELKEKQEELTKNIATYEQELKKRYDDIKQYDAFSLGIDDKVNVAKKELEMYEQMCSKTIGKTTNDVKLSSCTSMPLNGGWMKPLTYGFVTSSWGYRVHPVTGALYSFHNGMDIGGNSEGTPIYAAASGIVVAKVYRSSCGGNMLYINVNVNGEQFTTYYYHLLNFNVNVGDVVTQNTILGWVGGGSTSSSYGGYDYCTTGAHLHFGVAKGYYNTKTGIVRSSIITPPGFNNAYGYQFYSRYDMYR